MKSFINILEDQIIDILIHWLEINGWVVKSHCKGNARGIDIFALKGDQIFIIEAKGNKGNPTHFSTKRDKFNSSQLNSHLGMAIIKVLRERNNYPGSQIAIAHPDDEYVKKVLSPIIPDLQKIGIRFLWVNVDGKVSEEKNI